MNDDDFYRSDAWRALTKRVYKRYGKKCHATGLTEADGFTMSVDHIKPRSLYPHLELKMSNMQVLTLGLNKEKGTKHSPRLDFRPLRWKLYYRLKPIVALLVIVLFVASLFVLSEVDTQKAESLRLDFCVSDFVINNPDLTSWLGDFCSSDHIDAPPPDSSNKNQQHVYGQVSLNRTKTLIL